MSKSAKEIILETLEYYGASPDAKRGIKTTTYQHVNEYTGERTEKTRSSCEYVVTNGEAKYCAIGRCLTDEAKTWAAKHSGGVSEIVREWWSAFWARDEWDNSGEEGEYFVFNEYQDPEDHEEVYLDDMLHEDYRGQTIDFWDHLQMLHDESKFWDGGGAVWLTMDGYNHVNDMADRYLDHDENEAFMADLQAHTENWVNTGDPNA